MTMQKFIIIGQRKGTGVATLTSVSSPGAYAAEIATMANFMAYPWARLAEAQQALREAVWATPREKTQLLRKLKTITQLDKP